MKRDTIIYFHCYQFLTLKVPEKLPLNGLYVYYVVHICDLGMLRVNMCFVLISEFSIPPDKSIGINGTQRDHKPSIMQGM